MPKLGVNIDHVATLRQARREGGPCLLTAAAVCEQSGADSIVCHLREDRRHIQDADVRALRKSITTRFNLEMSLNKEIIQIAAQIRPDQCTLVPERRQELTTEGGLDVVKYCRRVKEATDILRAKKIDVSLFVDPDPKQIDMSVNAGVTMIELHTGCYARARTQKAAQHELRQLDEMTQYAHAAGLVVNSGHGLNYANTRPVTMIDGMEELNIGFSIIARAIFVGLTQAVKEMKALVAGRTEQ